MIEPHSTAQNGTKQHKTAPTIYIFFFRSRPLLVQPKRQYQSIRQSIFFLHANGPKPKNQYGFQIYYHLFSV